MKIDGVIGAGKKTKNLKISPKIIVRYFLQIF